MALVLPVMLIAFGSAHPSSASDLFYLGQIGLFDLNGGNQFTRNDGFQTSSRIGTSASTGVTLGTSNRYNGGSTQVGTAIWVASSTGVTTRIGLYDQGGGNQFTSSTGIQNSTYDTISADFKIGYTLGTSDRYNGGSTKLGTAAWLATPAGATFRVGFYDQGGGNMFTSSTGVQNSAISVLFDAAYASGTSTIYNGGSSGVATAAWVASPAGTTVRVGLYDQHGGNQFTSGTGLQTSSVYDVSTSGVSIGRSTIYNGGSNSSSSVANWLAAANGDTSRVGLYDQNGGSEFTSSAGVQISAPVAMNAPTDAFLGTSTRYNGGSATLGTAVWIVTPSLATTRVGFYDQGGGNQFTSSTGSQTSAYVNNVDGYFFGTSTRYNGGASALGTALWSASTVTGVTVRIGLYDQGGGSQFTSSTGSQSSTLVGLSEHFSAGTSTRYNGGASSLGTGAWVANNATGATTRIGLYDAGGGSQFTSSTGLQTSSIVDENDTYTIGTSTRYNGGASSLGSAAWVAANNTGITTRTGLYDQGGGNEFTSNTGMQSSTLVSGSLTDGGLVAGYSNRYNGGATQLGTAAWIANSATGAVTRVGLTGGVYTAPNGTRESYVSLFNDKLVTGISSFYDASSKNRGDDAWVLTNNSYVLLGYLPTTADVSDSIGILTDTGYIAGSSEIGINSEFGEVAWLYNANSQKELFLDFAAQAPSPDYFVSSTIEYLTDSGIAGGVYNFSDGNGHVTDVQRYLYIPDRGIYDLNVTLSDLDWTAASNMFLNPNGIVNGNATYLNNGVSSNGIYLFQATVPEPSALALVLAGGLLLGLQRRLLT